VEDLPDPEPVAVPQPLIEVQHTTAAFVAQFQGDLDVIKRTSCRVTRGRIVVRLFDVYAGVVPYIELRGRPKKGEKRSSFGSFLAHVAEELCCSRSTVREDFYLGGGRPAGKPGEPAPDPKILPAMADALIEAKLSHDLGLCSRIIRQPLAVQQAILPAVPQGKEVLLAALEGYYVDQRLLPEAKVVLDQHGVSDLRVLRRISELPQEKQLLVATKSGKGKAALAKAIQAAEPKKEPSERGKGRVVTLKAGEPNPCPFKVAGLKNPVIWVTESVKVTIVEEEENPVVSGLESAPLLEEEFDSTPDPGTIDELMADLGPASSPESTADDGVHIYEPCSIEERQRRQAEASAPEPEAEASEEADLGSTLYGTKGRKTKGKPSK
jgi:hypothetical protein